MMEGSKLKTFGIFFLIGLLVCGLIAYLFVFDLPTTYEEKIFEPPLYKYIRVILVSFAALIFSFIASSIYKNLRKNRIKK